MSLLSSVLRRLEEEDNNKVYGARNSERDDYERDLYVQQQRDSWLYDRY